MLSFSCSPPLSGDRAVDAFAGDVAVNRDDARRAPPAMLAAPPMADEDGAASAAVEEFLERRALIGYTQTAICVGTCGAVRRADAGHHAAKRNAKCTTLPWFLFDARPPSGEKLRF